MSIIIINIIIIIIINLNLFSEAICDVGLYVCRPKISGLQVETVQWKRLPSQLTRCVHACVVLTDWITVELKDGLKGVAF